MLANGLLIKYISQVFVYSLQTRTAILSKYVEDL